MKFELMNEEVVVPADIVTKLVASNDNDAVKIEAVAPDGEKNPIIYFTDQGRICLCIIAKEFAEKTGIQLTESGLMDSY